MPHRLERPLNYLFIIYLFTALRLFGSDTLFLRDELLRANTGDYVVTLQNKTVTLLHIVRVDGKRLIIEEISAPEKSSAHPNWKEWVSSQAPGHSSWVVYEIDVSAQALLEFYSLSQKRFIDIAPQESFLPTLLEMELSKVPLEDRKRIGQPPQKGEPDRRNLWQPPLVFEGNRMTNAKFEAYLGKWPKDGSPLAGKGVEVYLPIGLKNVPRYFPYWINVQQTLGRGQIRIIDTGTGLQSVVAQMPRRPPEFLRGAERQEGHVSFKLKNRPYFEELKLVAIPYDGPASTPVEIPATMRNLGSGLVEIRISNSVFNAYLERGQSYRFLAVPVGYDSLFAETTEPFYW